MTCIDVPPRLTALDSGLSIQGSFDNVIELAKFPRTQAARPQQTERTFKGAPGLVEVTYRSGYKTWVHRYTDPVTGKRTCTTLGSCTAIDETDARILVRTNVNRIKNGISPCTASESLSDFFEQRYMAWAQQHKRSWRDDKSRFNNYVRDVLGPLRLNEVTALQMQQLIDALRSGSRRLARRTRLSDGSINQVTMLFKSIFRQAYEGRFISVNPALKLKQLKLQNHRRSVYSKEELSKIFLGLQTVNPLVRILFVLLLATAARIGELLNARHTDVDELACTLFVGRNKANRPEHKPLSPEAMAAYAELKTLAVPGNQYLFPASRGSGPMAPPRKAFQKVLAAAGIQNKTFHDARRTAISEAVQAPGVSLLDASRMANHANTRITEERYVVVGDARVRHAANEIGKRLQLQMGIHQPTRPSSEALAAMVVHAPMNRSARPGPFHLLCA